MVLMPFPKSGKPLPYRRVHNVLYERLDHDRGRDAHTMSTQPTIIGTCQLSIESRLTLPTLIAQSRPRTARRFVEFFTAEIPNGNTRGAYARAVADFCTWCERRKLQLETITPVTVAAYLQQHPGSTPTRKQHLAAIRRLFDYLVTGNVIELNPAHSVRGPKHVVRKGKTPVLACEDARRLLGSIDVTTVAGLGDRALLGVMFYSFARVGAVVGMNVEDYYPNGKRWWFRLHEKGGKFHEVPAHHKVEHYMDEYLAATGISDEKRSPLFRSVDRRGNLTERRLIHQAGIGRALIHLEYRHQDGHVGLFCRFDHELRHLVLGPLSAKYPACRIDVVKHDCVDWPAANTWYAQLRLTPDLYPILRHTQFADLLTGQFEDPIDGILKAVQPNKGLDARVVIAIRPARRSRRRSAKRAVKRLDGLFFRRHFEVAGFYARAVTQPWAWLLTWPLTLLARGGEVRLAHSDTSGSRLHDREDDVQAASDKIGGHLFETAIRLLVRCGDSLQAHDRIRSLAGAFGALTKSRLATFRISRIRRGKPPTSRGRTFIFSAEELATLFHPPTEGAQAERLASTAFRELEPPVTLQASGERDGECVVGRVLYRDVEQLVGISAEDRLRHCHVLGRTGVGKSTLLLNQIRRDIETDGGICVIDPHGDLTASVARSVPRHRTNDVILFDPADEDFSVAFNPLACPDPGRRDLVADDVLAAFEKVYDLSQAPRLKDTLRNALYVLVEKEKTLLNLLMMLSDESYRQRLTAQIEDDVARLFWHREFSGWNDRYRTEALSAIQNKLRPFLMNGKIRAIIGQGGRSLSPREVMDKGKVLIVPLSKGKLGELNVHYGTRLWMFVP